MANTLYPLFKQALLTQSPAVVINTNNIYCALLKNGGSGTGTNATYAAANQYYNSLDASVIGTPQVLNSKTITNGLFSSANTTFSSVTSANNTAVVVIYCNSGTNTTSPLIAWLDTGTNIPITPNGGNITVAPDATNGWFAL